LQWWSEFKILVHENRKIKPVYKFIHLRRCLTDKAVSYIQELTPSGSNYDKVMKRLRRHFENINTQRESLHKKIEELVAVDDEFDKDKLRDLLTEAQLIYRRAKELKFASDYIDGRLMSDIKQLF